MKRVALIAVLAVAGCKTVPILDADGNPTGETKTVFAAEETGEGLVAAAPFVPPPFNLILPAIGGIIVAVAGSRKDQS